MANEDLDTGAAADAIEGIMDASGIEDFDDEKELDQETDQESGEELTLDEGAELEDEEAADDALEEDEEGAEDEDPGIENLEQLANALEIPLEELLANLTSSFKASGEDVTATLADLQKSYQNEADYRKKSMALAEERKGFETERQQRIEQFQANHAGLAEMTQLAGNFLKVEFNSPKLAELRETNQPEWMARRQELKEQFDKLGQVRQEAAENYTNFLASQQDEFAKEQGRILERDVEGWGEEKLGEAVEVIKDLGFHDDEMSAVVDARLFKGALELKALRDENAELKAKIAKGGKAAQKVKQKPAKVIKPGKSGGKVSRSKLTKAKAALKKSATSGKDNTREAAAVIENLI